MQLLLNIMNCKVKPWKVTDRQTAVLETCLPWKLQNFTYKFNGKELKWNDKYEIITSGDGLAHTMKMKGVLSCDFKELREPMLYPAKAKPPVFIIKVIAGTCHFFLPIPSPIQFICNLKNTQVKEKGRACLECVLTSEDVTLKGMQNGRTVERSPQYIMKCEGKRAELVINAAELSDSGGCTITDTERIWLVKQGAIHKLIADRMGEEREGRTFRAKGAESGATIAVGDSPVIEESVLKLFAAHRVTVKTKHTASIKVPFKAKPMSKVTRLKDGIEVTEEEKVVMDKASDALLTIKTCVREDSGAIMLNLKNDCGSTSGNPYLNFVNKLKPPQGKAEFLNTWGKCKMRWAPKGNGGKVTHFVIKRRMAGKKLWIKVGVLESNTTFATEKVEEGEAYFRICAINSEGLIKPLQTGEIFAGEPIKPPRQVSQPQVVDLRNDVTITWNFPAQDGGSPVQGYIIKKRKKSSDLCVPVTKEPVQEPPGLLQVMDFSSSSISLAWREPDQEDVLSGYILEMAEDTKKWTKCTKIPVSSTTYTVGGLQERQILPLNRAVNEAGMGEAVELQEEILAIPPSDTEVTVGRFDLTRLKSHMVVRAGTAPCIHTSFPVRGEILQLEFSWTSGEMQLQGYGGCSWPLSHELSLWWVYDSQVETYYGVLKCDVSTATWFRAAGKVYSNKYTVTGLLPGRKYFVIACNDTGDTDPLDSQEQQYISKDRALWICARAGEDSVVMVLALCLCVCMCNRQCTVKQSVVTLSSAECFDFKMKEHPSKDCVSHFITPLKNHSMSHGNDAMSCAFTSNPHPTVTLFKGNISITSKTKLWFNSTSSICLLMIPTTCSCKLIICGKSVCSHYDLLGMIPSRLNNHRFNVSEYGLHTSRASALTRTGTVDHTSLVQFGSHPCPTEEEIAWFAAGAARATL
ncbi:LOW QUALITY PROTEIN: immunoglobulin superfamily member 22 [Pluvialis apricaria]